MQSVAVSSQIRLRPAMPMPVRMEPLTPITLVSSGEEIYAPGAPADEYYRVEFGAVRIYRLLGDGRRQICAFHFAGETFGFAPDGTHQFFAEAICASGLRVLPVQETAAGQAALLRLALAEMTRAQEHLLVVGRPNALERIAAFLIDLNERQGRLGRVELQMSRQDIGDYLGLTIETVSRSLSKLRDQSVIRLNGLRDLHITRLEMLEALCD